MRSGVERLTASSETLGTNSSSVIDGRHRLVSRVSGNLNRVILNNVLLDDSVTSSSEFRLILSVRVEISLRKETVVARDVVSAL